MIVLKQNCELEDAKDKTLPRDSYLVEYLNEDQVCYDIVRAPNEVAIFDAYYDKSLVIQAISWTNGIVHAKMYGYVPRDMGKKKK